MEIRYSVWDMLWNKWGLVFTHGCKVPERSLHMGFYSAIEIRASE